MQEVFEKVIEKLANLGWVFADYYPDGTEVNRISKKSVPYDEVVEIFKQESKQYKDFDIEFAKKCVELAEKMNVCDLVAENCRLSNENRFLKINVCNNDWIPCNSGKLPEECTDVEVTVEETADDVGKKTYYNTRSWLQDGQWVIKKNPHHPTVIAWKYPAEPYQPKGE